MFDDESFDTDSFDDQSLMFDPDVGPTPTITSTRGKIGAFVKRGGVGRLR
jgi:hypothetical protein